MPRADSFTAPDALWDIEQQVCKDPTTHSPLPNYEGFCLLTHPRPMVLNTWLEGTERQWQFLSEGWYVTNKVLDDLAQKAS
jgi:hypothetical protein